MHDLDMTEYPGVWSFDGVPAGADPVWQPDWPRGMAMATKWIEGGCVYAAGLGCQRCGPDSFCYCGRLAVAESWTRRWPIPGSVSDA